MNLYGILGEINEVSRAGIKKGISEENLEEIPKKIP